MTDITIIKESIEKHLFSQPDTNVYAVLDGASVPDLPQVLWEMEPEHVCLYRGELEPDMAATAPYLVKLDQGHPFTDWVLSEGWGKHWGIFVVTPEEANLKTIRLHFRRFLMVTGSDGEPLYFRYYDPRVLRIYLPTCNDEETEIVCGPIQCFVCEDGDPACILKFWTNHVPPRKETVACSQAPRIYTADEPDPAKRPAPMEAVSGKRNINPLYIRQEQKVIFEQAASEGFRDRMVKHLFAVFPDETKGKSEKEIREFIEDGIKKAAGYDITMERELALFMDLMMGIGCDFEKRKPWIEKTLVKKTLTSREKMDTIYMRLTK